MKPPRYSADLALWFFGGASAVLLLVSMPATYAVVAPFHQGASSWGVWLALGTLLAFEVGAVGCKLVTLAIPSWSGRMNALTVVLLALTTLANYWHGSDLFASATLGASLASIRQAGYGPLVALVYAATIPLLLFVFLSASVARAKQLLAVVTASLAPEASADLARQQRDMAIVEVLATISQRLEASPARPRPAIVASASPAPVATASMPAGYACPHCGADVGSAGAKGRASRYGYCANCKTKEEETP